MFVVCSVLSVACCLVRVGRCSVFVVRRLTCVVWCLLCVAWCAVLVYCCWCVSNVVLVCGGCCVLFVACGLLVAVRRSPFIV